MEKAKNGDTVKVHYTGSLDDGTVFDSSVNREPLQFTLGKEQLIKGFEEAVLGMSVGETKTVTIPSDEAYGTHRDELMIKLNKSDIPPDIELRMGLVLQLQSPDGRVVPATITEISENSVTFDANHPLTGKNLTFTIDLIELH